MITSAGQQESYSFRRTALLCGSITVLIGTLGLLGWLLKLPILASFHHDYIPIASSTCIAFIVEGAILILWIHCPARAGSWAFAILVAMTSIFGMLAFVDHLLNVGMNFESLLFSSSGHLGPFPTNLMSPFTGLLFCLSGAALLLLLRYETKRLVPHFVCGLANFVTMAGLVGSISYAYGTPLLYNSATIPMALTTSMAFLFLGIGLSAAAGTAGFPQRHLTGDSARAMLLRAFVPLGFIAVVGSDILHQVLFGVNSALALAISAVFFGMLTVAVVALVARRIGSTIEKAEAERRRSEDALRTSEERFRLAMLGANDGLWDWDFKTDLVYYSPRWKSMLGYAEEELENHLDTWKRVVHPDDREPILTLVRDLIEGRSERFEVEFRMLHKDGHYLDILSRASLLHDSAGNAIRLLGTHVDITARKLAEEALRRSEHRVRLELESILSPEGDIGNLELADIIDTKALQLLVDDFYGFTRIPVSVIDLKGKVLVGVGWQDICTRFHRAQPETCNHCIESDTQLSSGVPPGKFKLYKCKNNMWDIATPLLVGGQHMGNLFSGQFFFDDEPLDYELFRSQAHRYGFDEREYIAALESVPRLGSDIVDAGIAFLVKLAHLISEKSYSNIKLARSLAERDSLMDSLRRSEERFRGIVEDQTELISRFLPDHTLVFVNGAYCRYFGESEEELIGKDFWHHLPDRDRQGLNEFLASLSLERPVNTLEHRVVLPNDEVRWLQWTDRAIFNSESKLIEYQAVGRDITERKQAEQERGRMEAQLRHAQKMEALGTLAGGIAHDFNNILGIIVGYTEMAGWDAGKGSSVHSNLQEVLKGANRAKDLVQQILAFSRRSEQERQTVQIGLIVKEVLKMLRATLPSTIEVKCEVATKAVLIADPTQIHQVLMNLCTNAAHAMRDGDGVLEVSLTDVYFMPEANRPLELQPGSHVKLTVKDTGHGIDPAIQSRIFDPFFTTKEVGKGTGLGLSVVHGIVKSHGGAIEVESLPGRGTTFHLFFPAKEIADTLEKEDSDPLPVGSERVLVVDDEEVLAMATARMLKRLGYDAEFLTNSTASLDVFRNELKRRPFDLVVTDMTMPHMTGTELARRLLDLQPQLPIVVCTGFSEKINSENAKELGIQGFLMKPIVLRDLAEVVRRVLD